MRSKRTSSETKSNLLRLFVERSGLGDPQSPADQVMTKLVEKVQGYRLENPEQRLQQALKQRNITSIVMTPDLGCDGMIEPIGSTFSHGFRIQMKSGVSGGRMRFTMAHEICHTFFYELVPELKFRSHETDQLEEGLCDLGAAALLIPAQSIRRRAKKLPICLTSLEQLAQDYLVSLPTMLLRLRALGLWKCELSNWHRSLSGDFVLDRLYGGRQAEWKWEDVSALKRAWESTESVFDKSFVYLRDDRGTKRYKPIAYNIRRFGTGVIALWGAGICKPEKRYPLLNQIRA